MVALALLDSVSISSRDKPQGSLATAATIPWFLLA
jgi:hypothetical protein